jgi:hypothetical protein
MEFQYKKELEKNGLTVAELPEDAQTGIDQINDVLKGFRMLEKRGQKPTPKALKKLKAMDKWVTYEIYDYLHDTDKNDDDIPFDAEDVLDGDQNEPKGDKGESNVEVDPIGLKIDAELEQLYASGKTVFSIEELGNNAKETYNVLFDSYEDGEENGVVTSRFSLIEGNDKKFTLKQK